MIRRFLARCKFLRIREERRRIEKAAVKIQVSTVGAYQ